MPPSSASAPPALSDKPPAARRAGWQGIGRDFLLLGLVAGLAVCLGLGINRWRARPLPLLYASQGERLQQSLARMTAAPPVLQVHPPNEGLTSASPQPELIDLARFHDLVEAKTIILDARPALFYRVGHVPGARSLARETFETDYAAQRTFLEPHRRDTLVIYCSGDACVDSRMVAAALQRLGYPHVLVFTGGWEEWQAAGLPEERG